MLLMYIHERDLVMTYRPRHRVATQVAQSRLRDDTRQ